MIQLSEDGQFVHFAAERRYFGEELPEYMSNKFGITVLPAGTVMVHERGSNIVQFQLLENFSLWREGISRRGTTLVAYEPGSLVNNSSWIGGFTFKRCRFPTLREYETYKERKTV